MSKYYLSDIEGLMINKTKHFYMTLFTYTIIISLLALATYTSNNRPAEVTLIIILLGVIFLMVRYILSGMTCQMHLVTKIQTKKIGGIIQRKKWKAIKNILVPLIESYQGKYDATQLNKNENILKEQPLSI
jgi:hypothetical protein